MASSCLQQQTRLNFPCYPSALPCSSARIMRAALLIAQSLADNPVMAGTLPLHIDRLDHDGANSVTAEYADSLGGAKDGVGTVLLGKPKGLSALTAVLRGLDVAPAEIETA